MSPFVGWCIFIGTALAAGWLLSLVTGEGGKRE